MPDLRAIVANLGLLRRGAGGALEDVTPAELAADPAFAGTFLALADVLDEADMATDSATKPPSQQSVVGYTAARFTALGAFVKPVVNLGLPNGPIVGGIEATGSGSLNRLELWPVPVPWPASVNQLGINITTAEASATPRLGLYAPGADGRPGALIVDGGTVDASTTGQKIVTLGAAAELTDGLVYFAIAWQGAATALRYTRRLWPSGGPQGAVALSSNATHMLTSGGAWSYSLNSVSGALPDPAAGASVLNGNVPTMWLRVAALL